MTTRNVNLPDHLSAFVDDQVREQRHGSPDEVIQEALDRYSQDVAEEAELMARVEAAAEQGIKDIEEGRCFVLNGPEEVRSFIQDISDRVGQRYASVNKLG